MLRGQNCIPVLSSLCNWLSMAGRERTNVAHALNRLTDPVFVAALSSRDRSSNVGAGSGLLRRPGNGCELQREEESGNCYNWPGAN